MWLRHRSAPAAAWLAAAVGLIVFAVVAVILDITVLRPARDESSFTRGIPRATLSDPSPARAVYRVVLRASDRELSPAGHRSVAYRWFVRDANETMPLCRGESTTMHAEDDGARAIVAVPLNEADWPEPVSAIIPRRIAAVCPSTSASGRVEYAERRVTDGVRADVVGCESRVDGLRVIGECNDSVPSRVYLLPSRALGRARARRALDRVAATAVAFALTFVIAGVVALRLWRRPPT